MGKAGVRCQVPGGRGGGDYYDKGNYPRERLSSAGGGRQHPTFWIASAHERFMIGHFKASWRLSLVIM